MNHQDARANLFKSKLSARETKSKSKKKKKKRKKRKRRRRTMKRLAAIQSDLLAATGEVRAHSSSVCSRAEIGTRSSGVARAATKLIFALLLLAGRGAEVHSYCPSKCRCDNQLLLANCTQNAAITIVPMTLNPLLRRLTLSQLPMAELSNSLSVYRQLEYLDLSANQLRQIRYENFNSKPPPTSIMLHHSSSSNSISNHFNPTDPSVSQRDQLNANNQQLARQLKQSVDRSIDSSPANSASGSVQQQQTLPSDEIRFHLRELDLSDNKIELLGDLLVHQNEDQLQLQPQPQLEPDQAQHQPKQRLRSAELERLAPFLTLTKLSRLSLAGNRLVRLNQHVFLGLVHLKRLDLSRNQLETIDRHALVSLIALERLDLAHNRLVRHFHSLGLALCRAPAIELEQLDLGGNQEPADSIQQQQTTDILLPNQMFVCAPKLKLLDLSWLRLRHIQVNAFDNLQQLERLNLSRNLLERVPSESLTAAGSNLSSSLQQLDLSDTRIDFVPAGAFAALSGLRELSMNSMAKLVSFDLASLAPSRQTDARLATEQNVDQLMRLDNGFRTAVQSLLPEHLLDRIVQRDPSQPQPPSAANPVGGDNLQSADESPANRRLQQLELRNNKRLQSFHSSAPTKLRFAHLRLLDLSGSSELREVALEKMIDFGHLRSADGAHLRVDLSFASNLNCSSCQLSWLIEAAERRSHAPIELLSSVHSIGCSAPMSATLGQLIGLQSSFSPLLGHCQRAEFDQVPDRDEPTAATTVGWRLDQVNGDSEQRQGADDSGPGATIVMMLVLSCVLAVLPLLLLLLLAGGKLVFGRQRLKFHSTSPTSSSSNTNSNSSAGSPSGCTGARQLVATLEGRPRDELRPQMFHRFANFYRQQPNATRQASDWLGVSHAKHHHHPSEWPSNLFSRIVGRLRADNICRRERSPLAGRSSKRLPPLPAQMQPTQRAATHIIENVVYAGDKILAANQQPNYYILQQHQQQYQQQQDTIRAAFAVGANQRTLSGPTLGDSFIRADVGERRSVYANCYQQLAGCSLAQVPSGGAPHWPAHGKGCGPPIAAGGAETCGSVGPPEWTGSGASCGSATLASLDGSSAAASSVGGRAARHEPGRQHLAQVGQLEGADGGHIYVTLDRPIKQRNGRDEYKRQFVVREQDGLAFESQPSGLPNCLAPAAEQADETTTAAAATTTTTTTATTPTQTTTTSTNGQSELGRFWPEVAADEFRANNRSSRRPNASRKRYAARSDSEALCAQEVGGNVTGHTNSDGSDSAAQPNCGRQQQQQPQPSSRQLEQQQQQLFMDGLNGFAEQTGRAQVRMMDARADVARTERRQLGQVASKYDANHAVGQREACADYAGRWLPVETTFDNDYVINGLNLGPAKQLPARRPQTATATAIADSRDPVNKRRSLGVASAGQPPSANNDGRQRESRREEEAAELESESESDAPMENGNPIMFGQRDSADNRRARPERLSSPDARTNKRNLDKSELAATEARQEIYSNQFYYCRPSKQLGRDETIN